MSALLAGSPRPAALSKEEFQDLKVLDSCSIADAIERFHVPFRNEGYAEGGLVCRFPYLLPMLGYAVTLKVRSASPVSKSRGFFESADFWTALFAVPAPRVLVLQDIDRHPGAAALIGEMQACVLKSLDCVGVVTNGAVRDVTRIEGFDFQMFSGSLAVSPAHCHMAQVGGQVQIGGLEMAPGDLVHGDSNGIVKIPRELAARIPATAAALRKKEEAVMDYCHSAEFSVEGLRDLFAA